MSQEELVSLEKVKSLIRDVGRHLSDEKLYKEEHISEIFKLKPSPLFVKFLNSLLSNFTRKNNLEKFLREFLSKTHSNWREYFSPHENRKVVFLLLIHLPERVVRLAETTKGNPHIDQGINIFKFDKLWSNFKYDIQTCTSYLIHKPWPR